MLKNLKKLEMIKIPYNAEKKQKMVHLFKGIL